MRRRLAIPPESVVVSTIASLVPIKGHGDLLCAMARVVKAVPDVRCVLVGDGPLRGELEQLAWRHGLSKTIVFAGVLDEDLKNALIQMSDVVVLPSLSEGLPVALLEATAAGRPVVATDAGGNREIVEPGVTGLLVQPGDPAALATAILTVVSDKALAEQMGRAGRRRSEAAFSFGETVAQVGSLYKRLLAGA